MQNAVVVGNAAVVTMTSLELVEFINQIRQNEGGYTPLQHKNFLAKVEVVLGFQSAKFLADYTDGRGRVQKCYRLPKREATLMAMSYSHEISAQVYDRMEELERQVQKPAETFKVPQSFRQALLLAAEQQKQIEEQQKQLEEAKPKVEFHDNFVKNTYTYTATDIAKKLGVSAQVLNNWLVAKDAMYGTRKHLKQWYMDAGYGVEKFVGVGLNVFQQVRHTSKGADWIMSNFKGTRSA